MGLWMIQSLRRELGGPAFPALTEMARSAEGFPSRVDVDSHDFFAPEHMGRAVEAFCARTGQPVPATPGETLQCVYRSLAAGYGEAVAVLSRLTGRRYTSLNIIGGGSRDGYLNRLTAEATGLEVFAGPSEGTALGNLIVQALAAGTFPSLAAAREAVRKSFEITAF
jgi:rhamnulokinase